MTFNFAALQDVKFGDGVNTCSACGYTLTLLFMSTACDRCDGLLKQETVRGVEGPANGYTIGARVLYRYGGGVQYKGSIVDIRVVGECKVLWDHDNSNPNWHFIEELVLI